MGERGFGRWPCFLWGVGISVAEALQEWRQNQSWAGASSTLHSPFSPGPCVDPCWGLGIFIGVGELAQGQMGSSGRESH